MNWNKKLPGFTLSELLVVLVIIGILIVLALPNLMPLIGRTRALEAKRGLQYIYTLQKTHFMEYARYSDSLDDLGWEQESMSDEGGNSNYSFEIEADGSGFLARATAITDFDGDGEYNVWEITEDNDLTEIVKD